MAEAKKPVSLNIEELRKVTAANYQRNKFILLAIFATGVCVLTLLWWFAPALSDQDAFKLFRIPRRPSDLRLMYEVISVYTADQYWWVFTGFCFLYLFL
jgi:hypothetical protein